LRAARSMAADRPTWPGCPRRRRPGHVKLRARLLRAPERLRQSAANRRRCVVRLRRAIGSGHRARVEWADGRTVAQADRAVEAVAEFGLGVDSQRAVDGGGEIA